MSLPIPFDAIRQNKDRSWTVDLVKLLLLPSTNEFDREKVSDALIALDDYRCCEDLTQAFLDRERPAEVRKSAFDVLASAQMVPDAAARRGWWDTGDDLVRARVLFHSELGDADLIDPILEDPDHHLYWAALEGIEIGFDTRRYQRYKIDALRSNDAKIREQAAEILLWDEPVAAEQALLDAINDAESGVAREAVRTLRYYQSRSVLRRLAEVAESGPPDIRDVASESYHELRYSFVEEVIAAEGTAYYDEFRQWCEPIWDLVEPQQCDRVDRTNSNKVPKKTVPPVLKIVESLNDVDGLWEGKLDVLNPCRYDWSDVTRADFNDVVEFLTGHPDRSVRRASCALLVSRDQVGSLLRLASKDQDSDVRQDAMSLLSHLSESSRSNEVADFAWSLVSAQASGGWRAYEALDAFIHHGDPNLVQSCLLALARDDLRKSIRWLSVISLNDTSSLGSLLDEQPILTWSIHALLLEDDNGPVVDSETLDRLSEVDDLRLQVALIENCARRSAHRSGGPAAQTTPSSQLDRLHGTDVSECWV